MLVRYVDLALRVQKIARALKFQSRDFDNRFHEI